MATVLLVDENPQRLQTYITAFAKKHRNGHQMDIVPRISQIKSFFQGMQKDQSIAGLIYRFVIPTGSDKRGVMGRNQGWKDCKRVIGDVWSINPDLKILLLGNLYPNQDSQLNANLGKSCKLGYLRQENLTPLSFVLEVNMFFDLVPR